MPRPDDLTLLTGVTSNVGSRLLTALQSAGHRVRCLVRSANSTRVSVTGTTEVVRGDAFDPASLQAAMQGVGTAYYLIYSGSSDGPFEEDAHGAALRFGTAARQAGVRRIVHLRGLNAGGKYSGKLDRPEAIGDALRESRIQVVEFNAPVIIGPGSLAFEMARGIAERLAVIIAPRWTRTLAQPIAVEDVVAYLEAALQLDVRENVSYELGGADKGSFLDLIKEYARQRGLKRIVVPWPLLMPRLSILGLSLAIPSYARIGQELVAALCHRTPPDNSRALEDFPVCPRGIREVIKSAVDADERRASESESPQPLGRHSETRDRRGSRFGLRIVNLQVLYVPYAPALAFRPIERIGGSTGWYYANWLWQLRGWLDVVLGGVGMSRGRRDPDTLAPGDPVDFWRVEAVQPGRMLRLAADMRLPGRAWLQFDIEEVGQGSTIRQAAIFDPIGLAGLLYWYVLYPAHEFIFPGLVRGIGRAIRG